MYTTFYGLRDLPFNVTPDPRCLYLNECYQEAIAALAYGIEARKGFISLIGEAGTGKTTLLRRLLDTLEPNVRSVLLLHPTVVFDEILEHILQELGIPTEGARKLARLQRLNEFLLENTRAGGNVVLLIDEAQDLDIAVLEELRLLSNLETGKEKILQIVLTGQPELEARLNDVALRQLRQRITLHIRIRPLAADEVTGYVLTRLEHAGAPDTSIFTPEALARVAAHSGGIPRVVNVLCDASLLAGFASGSKRITAAIVDETWTDYHRSVRPPPLPSTTDAPTMMASTGTVAAPAAPAPAASAPPIPGPVTASPLEATPVVEPEARSPVQPVVAKAQPPAAAAETATPPAAVAEQVPLRASAPDLPTHGPTTPPPAPSPSFPAAESPAAPTSVRTAPPATPRRVTPVALDKPLGPTPTHRLYRERAARVSPAMSLGVAGLLVVVLAAGLYALSRRDDGGLGSLPAGKLPPVAPLAAAPKPVADPAPPLMTPPAHPAATAPEPAPPPPVAEAKPTAAPVTIEPTGPVSAAEAAFLMEEFRLAYEARDVERIRRLFSADAVENDRRGREAVALGYQRAFEQRTDIEYRLPSLRFEQRGDRVIVRSPFVTRFRKPDGSAAQLTGSGEWQIERREGGARVVVFTYQPATAPKRREPQDRVGAGPGRSSPASRASDAARVD